MGNTQLRFDLFKLWKRALGHVRGDEGSLPDTHLRGEGHPRQLPCHPNPGGTSVLRFLERYLLKLVKYPNPKNKTCTNMKIY